MPHLTIVIGGNGAGKTTWANTHRNVLPSQFYNADSIAVGLGDWNDEERQREAREIVDQQIQQRLKALDDFGFESTYSGRSRPAIVEQARACSYGITAVFIGTESPEINVQRVAERTKNGTGHAVKPSEIAGGRYAGRVALPPCTVGSPHHWVRSTASGSRIDAGRPRSSTSTAASRA